MQSGEGPTWLKSEPYCKLCIFIFTVYIFVYSMYSNELFIFVKSTLYYYFWNEDSIVYYVSYTCTTRFL